MLLITKVSEKKKKKNNICLSAANGRTRERVRDQNRCKKWCHPGRLAGERRYGGKEKEEEKNELVVDCENCLLFPCFLDAHTHLIKRTRLKGAKSHRIDTGRADASSWTNRVDGRAGREDYENRF